MVFATMIHLAVSLPNWNSLESVRRAHTDLEGTALVFFALLVIAETLAHLTESKRREVLFDKIGITFFAIAVMSEIVAFPYGQRNDTLAERVIGSLDVKARNAYETAARAKSTADGAQEKADAVGKEAETIQQSLNTASGQLGLIEQKVSQQGPRWKLLEAKKDYFIKALKPFAGQKILVMYCGRWGAVQTEQMRLGQDTQSYLSTNDGAGWNEDGKTWDNCPPTGGGTSSVGGNLIVVSMEAETRVKESARALKDALNNIGISTIGSEQDPKNQLFARVFGPGSVWEQAFIDPTRVVILIGDNPMTDVSDRKKRRK